jgi:LVIVD repeat
MGFYRLVRDQKLSLLSLSLAVALSILSVPSGEATGLESSRPVQKATCGPQDRTETVQGETTLAERFSSGAPRAYSCNLELVGQYEGEGAGAGLDTFRNCVYFSVIQNPKTQHPGVTVLDVSDPYHPKPTAYLDSPGMLGAFESVVVSPARGLLAASQMSMTDPAAFDLYDISADCRHPVLRSSVSFPGLYSHFGQFSTDGRLYYGSRWPFDPKLPATSAIFIIDVSDASHPHLVLTWHPTQNDWLTHSVVVSSDGNRAYISVKRTVADLANAPNPNGLAILDVSELRAGRPNPQVRVISTLFWSDTHASEGMQPVTIRGKPYLAFSDNEGAVGFESPKPAEVCISGKPGYGFARIIDLSDENHPRTASKLMLEVADPSNCTKAMHDPTGYGAYGSYACIVDHPEEGKLLACASFEVGLRIFDIRDPVHPKEVAYYKPPARHTESRPGSIFPEVSSAKDHTTDTVVSFPRFRKDGQEIWVTSGDNGFQVLRFSARFTATHPDLFRN